ncbi:allatostatin-A receptor-like [Saccoglossus kowalevskii]|uniref:Allatostatin-A receptor-like n=1 Tax=Saccoglossus kowalevskii TaxID=10224 RepID=A0ABM0N195_SACKO|nr:PREDICTED: allatostatin-A receptor-like [Saccoglossus kowalevskii]
MTTVDYTTPGSSAAVIAEDDGQYDYMDNFTYYVSAGELDKFLYSRADTMIVCVLMPAVFIIGFIGNALTVYVFMRGRGMQSVTNLLLVNLAIADIIFLLVVVPPKLYMYASASVPLLNDWTALGNAGCKAFNYLSGVTIAVSCITIIILALEKYLAIRWYIKFRVYRTKKNVVIICVVIWLFCLVYMIPELCFKVATAHKIAWPEFLSNHTDLSTTFTQCGQCFGTDGCQFYSVYYVIGQFLFLCMLPLLVCVYLLILMRLVQTERSTGKSLTAKASYRAKKQLIRMLLATTLVFLICIVPYRMIALIVFYQDHFSLDNLAVSVSLNVCRTMTYINSAANPIIYNVLCDKYRQAFKETLTACLPKSDGYECHNDANGMVTMTTLSTRRGSRGKKCEG